MTIKDFQILSQWFSPNFPTGGFAFSHGIDALIAESKIATLADLKSALTLILENGGAHSDAVFLALAYKGHDTSALAIAYSASAERLEETQTQGANFVRAVKASHNIEISSAPYPVAVGQAARVLELDLETTLAFYLQSFLTNIAMIAQRLVPFSAIAVNEVLAELHDPIAKVAKQSSTATLDDIHSSAWLVDFASLTHETQGVRLCKT